MTPLNDNVVIKLEEAGVSKGGIHLPKNHDRVKTGVVSSVPENDDSDVVPGDRVLFIGLFLHEFTEDGDGQAVIVHKDSLIAKL